MDDPIPHFNRLTRAEDERLAWLVEELGESIQAIGKVLRHGYASDNKGLISRTNRATLERELGHVAAATVLMIANGDISEEQIDNSRSEKLATVGGWLHHQGDGALERAAHIVGIRPASS